jgi:hypothetical protein
VCQLVLTIQRRAQYFIIPGSGLLRICRVTITTWMNGSGIPDPEREHAREEGRRPRTSCQLGAALAATPACPLSLLVSFAGHQALGIWPGRSVDR